MLVLISGCLCLLAAVYLMYAMLHLSDSAGQVVQKMGWTYFCMLIVIGVHHLVISMVPIQDDFFKYLLDTAQNGFFIFVAIFGILFSGYLSVNYRAKSTTPKNNHSLPC